MIDYQLTRRKHLRARLNQQALYVSDDYVFHTAIYNISQGGVLLEGLANIPSVRNIPLMIPLVHFPEFSTLNINTALNLKVNEFEITLFRVKAKITRNLDELNDLRNVLVTKVGCEFISPGHRMLVAIENYVKIYAKNLVFLLAQFEKGYSSEEQQHYIRAMASLLGHDSKASMNEIRFKALHDYQSLED